MFCCLQNNIRPTFTPSAAISTLFPSTNSQSPPSPVKERRLQQLPDKAGTTLLLVHGGEPRTNFYARTYLGRVLVDQLRVPKWIGQWVADFCYACFSLPARCVADSLRYPQNVDQLQWLKQRLELALTRLLPEFGPFHCLPTTAQEDTPSVRSQLQSAIRDGMDHLLVFPLQQQQRRTNRTLLSAIRQHIDILTIQLQNADKTHWRWWSSVTRPPSSPGAQFVAPRHSSVSFSLLIADDQVAWTNGFVQYWLERVSPLINDDRYRAIIFMAARPARIDQLEHAARRVMHAFYRTSPFCTPWRCAVYYAWEQPFGHWVDRLPLMRWRRHTLAGSVYKLRKRGIDGPFLVIPLDLMFECFDLHTTLPSLIESLETSSRNMVHLLPKKPLAEDSALVHSLAELVKHVMLNPEKFAPPPRDDDDK